MSSPLDEIFGGFRPPDPADVGKKIIEDVKRRAEVDKRIDTLKRRAQNNIDRAHNRADAAVLQGLDDAGVVLTLPQRKALRALYRDQVRHAKEFGKD